MLFARAYIPLNEPEFIREQIERLIDEDLHRGYSFWDGDLDPALPQDPGIYTLEELTSLIPKTDDELSISKMPHLSRGGILPGLCALCAAETYRELARKFWDAQRQERPKLRKWWEYIAIFEGEPVGQDAEGWPLFTAKKLLAIVQMNAIVSEC